LPILPEVEDTGVIVTESLVTGDDLVEESPVKRQVCNSCQQPTVTW